MAKREVGITMNGSGVSLEARDRRFLLISAGVIGIILGIVLLVWPKATVVVLAVILGLQLVALGVVVLVLAVAGETSVGEKILGALLGVLAVLAGVAVFSRPLRTAVVLVVVVGAFWVVGGVIEFVSGLFGEVGASRWLTMLGGVASLVAGVIMLSWPGPTIAVLVWIVGFWSLAMGAVRLVLGLTTPTEAAAA